MSNIQSSLNSLLTRAGQGDPVMLTVLQEIVDELDRLGYIVDPAPVTGEKITPVAPKIPGVVIDFTYEFTTLSVILRWTPPDFDFQFYELRKGTVWNTASRVLVTNSIEAVLDPITVGTHTYLLKTISVDGEYSEEAARVDVVVPTIGPSTISAEVSINNVLLRWNRPVTTFEISYYIVKKNNMEITRQDGQFFVYAEINQGTYKYTVIAVDVAGNVGPENNIVVDVAAFPDFSLIKSITSNFIPGTKINSKIDERGRLLFALDLGETIQQHFDRRGWASPQAQINAGYTWWITPVPTTASYEETFDFGIIYTSVIVSISWMFEMLIGSNSPTFGIYAQVSDNNINFTGNYTTQTFYVMSARYIKIKMSFTSADDKALTAFSNYMVGVSVKREQDAGQATAVATDPSGTVVTFNKIFKDIDGITIAPMSVETVIPIVDFLDVPNPTYFRVKIYDNAGVRKTVVFRWDARGVV